MAEQTEVVVFEIDVSSYERALKTQADSIELLKQKQKELRKAAEEGNEAAAETLEKVNAQLKVQQQEYRTTQAVLVGYLGQTKKATDTNNFFNNSIQQNRDLLKQLTAQYINTAKPSAELTNKVKNLSDALKFQEKQIGDTRRNVGNYADSILEAIGASSGLGKVIDPLKNIKGAFKDAGGGAAGLSSALSTGLLGVIPLVAGAFSSLTGALKDYAPIADLVEDSTAAISAGFKALITGGDITGAAEQAIAYTRALRDLQDTQESFNLTQQDGENQLNRVLLASKNVGLDTGQRLELLKQADIVERNLYQQRKARNEQEIKINQDRIEKTVDLTEKEKIQFEFGSASAKLQIRDKLEAAGVETKVIDAFDKALTERAKLEGESIALREKIANRRSQLLDKQEAEEEKAAQKEKDRLDRLAKEREQYLTNLGKLENEFLLNDRQRLEKSFDEKLATIKGDSQREIDLRFAIEQDKQAALEKFDADAAKKIEDARKEREAKAIEAKRKELTELLGLSQQLLDNELAQVDLSIGGEQFKADQKKAITLKYLNDQLALAQQLAEVDNVLTDSEIANLERLRLQIEKVQQQTTSPDSKPATLRDSLGLSKEQTEEIISGLNTISDAVNAVSTVINATYEVRQNEIEKTKNAEIEAVQLSTDSEEEKAAKIKKIEQKAAQDKYDAELSAFEANKSVQIINAVIGTAVGVANAFQLGPIAGAIAAALIAATGAAQIAVISSQQPPPPPKFATGVIGLDGAGTETSDSIDAKLSRGESVITAKATKRFHKELAAMEVAVGNTPNYQFGTGHFAEGVINVPAGDAGFSTRGIQTQVLEQSIQNSILTGLKNMPSPIVSVAEIDRVTNARNKSVRVAEL